MFTWSLDGWGRKMGMCLFERTIFIYSYFQQRFYESRKFNLSVDCGQIFCLLSGLNFCGYLKTCISIFIALTAVSGSPPYSCDFWNKCYKVWSHCSLLCHLLSLHHLESFNLQHGVHCQLGAYVFTNDHKQWSSNLPILLSRQVETISVVNGACNK